MVLREFLYFKLKNIQIIILQFLLLKNYNHKMKSLSASKRSKAIFGIGILAMSIAAISKKVISFPTGGCMKGAQELTLKKEINTYFN